ncbi:MAG: ATP-NAD kinase family protein [Candidatus Thermoplasmatota archaeon]|nr:ATP-NAD kinase family protein [Candidatus Thermoplasmatota archaeon]
MSVKIAFIVNPVAGMGGSVGLKGTDGEGTVEEALARGATPVSPDRAIEALRSLLKKALELEFITCSGEMGEAELKAAGIEGKVVFRPGHKTDAQDTKLAIEEFLRHRPDLLVFAGGDGTARDVLEAVGSAVPMVGIPAGVKMHSAVFAMTPESLGDLVESFATTGLTRDSEVMDVDEDSFRRGVLEARLHGYARVPDDVVNLQSSKAVYHSGSADEEAAEIGQYIAETMAPGTAYILGPGSTTSAITKHLGLEKTLLGVDVVLDGSLVLRDATESQLLELLGRSTKAIVVVTPIGSQGFIFGRGNQQISARVLRIVGPANVCVVATPTKLRDTPVLRVDSGDSGLDASFKGSIKVVIGYKRRKLMMVA